MLRNQDFWQFLVKLEIILAFPFFYSTPEYVHQHLYMMEICAMFSTWDPDVQEVFTISSSGDTDTIDATRNTMNMNVSVNPHSGEIAPKIVIHPKMIVPRMDVSANPLDSGIFAMMEICLSHYKKLYVPGEVIPTS